MIFLLLFLLIAFPIFSQEIDIDEDLLFAENEGLIITGTVKTSQQIAVIDKEEIERRNSADLASLLQETLDVNINSYGAYGNQSGITLRGFDSKRVAFLIDGVPVDSASNGKFDIHQIDLNSVERIEVIYGGSDSKFNISGALGGVINIVTVKEQKPGWRFNSSLANTSAMPGEYRGRDGQTQSPRWEDLADTQNFSLSAAYGNGAVNDGAFSFTTNLFANRAQNHFLFKDYTNYTRRKDNNEVWDTGANVSAVWELPNLSKIIASSNFYYGDKNFPVSGFSSYYNNQKDFSTRQSFMLDAPRAFHDNFAAEVSLSYNFGRLDYSQPETAVSNDSSRHDQHNLNIINRWSWFASERLTLRSGIDYKFIFLGSTEIGNRDRHDGGIYLTAEFQPVKKIMIVPSVKAVFTSGSAEVTTAIPKLGILWNVTDLSHPAGAFAIKNNYFRSFKFPDFEELYWTGAGGTGNPDLFPEDGWGGDIGVEWKFKNYVKLESVFFTQWIKNSIHWYNRNDNNWRPENVGEAVFFGLDNKLSFEIPISRGPFKKISPSISYKYLRSYLLSFGYSFDSDKRIPYNPEHTIGVSLDFVWGTGSLLITG
jgi:vitamin B12 transporter